ncbi:MAG TPA: sigma-70 family RNA polymerase sigma factor [Terriglobales bacterium]|jgi:RNA polymerase sigma factor (sigma-70 family)|nr:sigma-70 family RNA polymerase sigma factor [Terriglobales bacterium]
MDEATTIEWMTTEQDRRISAAVQKERVRLRSFIRRRVADEADAEDILQDVFYEFVQAYRLMKPIEQAGAWLFRVARNRIIDLYRKRKHDPLREPPGFAEDGESFNLEDLLPSPESGPEAVFARSLLLAELDDALDELPEEQREVFVAHELEGQSFRELAAATGLSVNTLLSRKRYAVLHLRRRLKAIHSEFSK